MEAAIKNLRDRINNGGPYENCAKDAVAMFDSFAGQYSTQLLQHVPLSSARRGRLEGMRFHNLESVDEAFRTISIQI
jgi:hypothetical protein